MADYSNKMEKAAKLIAIKGHPLQTFTRENEVLSKLLVDLKQKLQDGADKDIIMEALESTRPIAIHYAKKGDLLYPNLKVRYEIDGPSDLMWTDDDKIRDEINLLVGRESDAEDWFTRVNAVVKELENMIYKDNRVLFPICAVNFTQEEWIGIYQDAKDYPVCFGVISETWEEGEMKKEIEPSFVDGEIVMPGGSITVKQLTALLNTIPMEITFIDDENINKYFNEGPKVFKRPGMAIGREVFSCHPPKVSVKVRKILEEFKKGTLDQVPLWMEKNGRIMTVTYMAVRDDNKNYIGTVELVQDMEHAREYFEKKTVKWDE